MDRKTARTHVYMACRKFFEGEPTPPDWVDFEDPDMAEDLKPPPVVYHYAKAESFPSIAASEHGLRATDSKHLNDSGEIQYGYDIVHEALDELKAEIGTETTSLLNGKLERFRDEPSYVSCFSQRYDSLSQWRCYADETRGYCLGFRPQSSQSMGSHGIYGFRAFGECRYGADAVRARVRERMLRKIDRVNRMVLADPQYRESRTRFLASELAMVAWRHAHLAKHEHFREELEYRCIVHPLPGSVLTRKRERDGVDVPYVMTGPLEIKEVWIGPRHKEDQAIRETTLYLKGLGETDVVVRYWATPYRPV